MACLPSYSTTLDLTVLGSLLPVLNAHIPPFFNPPLPSKHPTAISPNAIFSEPLALEQSDASRQYSRLTFLPLLLKALSRAMLEWPIFRTTITPGTEHSNKPTLSLRPNADISVALSTPTGLYSPTIQGVDKLSAYAIMGELKRLQYLGRQVPSGLTLKEMPKGGGTVTVSNVGAIGKGGMSWFRSSLELFGQLLKAILIRLLTRLHLTIVRMGTSASCSWRRRRYRRYRAGKVGNA